MHIYLKTPSIISHVIVIVEEDLNPNFYSPGHEDGIEKVYVWNLNEDDDEECTIVSLFGADCDGVS